MTTPRITPSTTLSNTFCAIACLSNTFCAIACLSSLLLLSACAAKIISNTDDLIVIQARERNRAEALELAETQCLQRGLHARLTRRVAEDQLGYECVR